jgi:uncharacterized protein YndB with AHSA1/START domain
VTVQPPLRLSFEVACPPAHAFEVWTSRISLWWPADHTATGEEGLSVIMEPGTGGRLYQRAPDGTEIDWGEVTTWEPPARLGYLWYLRRDRVDATDVMISFRDLGGGVTCVEIEHTGWERLGGDATLWRERNEQGWSTLLPHFLTAIDGGPS